MNMGSIWNYVNVVKWTNSFSTHLQLASLIPVPNPEDAFSLQQATIFFLLQQFNLNMSINPKVRNHEEYMAVLNQIIQKADESVNSNFELLIAKLMQKQLSHVQNSGNQKTFDYMNQAKLAHDVMRNFNQNSNQTRDSGTQTGNILSNDQPISSSSETACDSRPEPSETLESTYLLLNQAPLPIVDQYVGNLASSAHQERSNFQDFDRSSAIKPFSLHCEQQFFGDDEIAINSKQVNVDNQFFSDTDDEILSQKLEEAMFGKTVVRPTFTVHSFFAQMPRVVNDAGVQSMNMDVDHQVVPTNSIKTEVFELENSHEAQINVNSTNNNEISKESKMPTDHGKKTEGLKWMPIPNSAVKERTKNFVKKPVKSISKSDFTYKPKFSFSTTMKRQIHRRTERISYKEMSSDDDLHMHNVIKRKCSEPASKLTQTTNFSVIKERRTDSKVVLKVLKILKSEK